MAITGISSYDGKQIVAAGAQSATKAYQDSNGDVITSKYQSTADMSNYVKNTDPVISVGFENTATNWSFSQGEQNNAVTFSLAQGNQNTALTVSFAQGSANYARGDSFAQGSGCKADQKSIAQGADCSAINSAQAFGVGVVARTGMMAIGSYNNKTAYASFVIGNGTANDARSDIFYIDKSGNVSAAGKISANGVELGPGGGGGGGVVTATGGTTTYVQTINNLNISASNAGSALSATDAYNLTNTAIKVASATSANYAVNADAANTATYASNGVALTSTYNSARSGYAASAYIINNITGKINNWNNTYSFVNGKSAFIENISKPGFIDNGFTNSTSNDLRIYTTTSNYMQAHNGYTGKMLIKPVGDGTLYNVDIWQKFAAPWTAKGSWSQYKWLSAATGGHFVGCDGGAYTTWNSNFFGKLECFSFYDPYIGINIFGTTSDSANMLVIHGHLIYATW